MSRLQASIIDITTATNDPVINGNVWTGLDDLSFDSKTYKGIGNILQISEVINAASQTSKRIRVIFDASKATDRNSLITFDAATQIKVRDIYSDDFGKTWNLTGLNYVGQVSNPHIDDSFTFSCELETSRGLAREGRPQIWSNEAQLKRYPGDNCFKYLEKISQGVESRWV